MFGNKKKKPRNRIDSLIGADTHIEGNVTFNGGLRVDGHVKGDVTATGDEPSTLVVSERAKIEGTLSVSHIVINGKVAGPVHAREYLELQAHSNVVGDVFYRRLEMHLGAVVEGKFIHQDTEVKSLEYKSRGNN
jgi:cytoskeletal protein CcmA (bactofilin family)